MKYVAASQTTGFVGGGARIYVLRNRKHGCNNYAIEVIIITGSRFRKYCNQTINYRWDCEKKSMS